MGTKTLADVKVRVKRTFGDESGVQLTDQDIVRWTNDAMRDIVTTNEGVLEAIALTDAVAGQQAYTPPADMITLNNITYKSSSDTSYYPIRARSMQQFNIEADGWDGSAWAQNRRPFMYGVWNNTIQFFPIPDESFAGAIKIYYQRLPVEVVDDGDLLDLPDPYFNAVCSYCLARAYRDSQNAQEFYPTITARPEDEDWF